MWHCACRSGQQSGYILFLEHHLVVHRLASHADLRRHVCSVHSDNVIPCNTIQLRVCEASVCQVGGAHIWVQVLCKTVWPWRHGRLLITTQTTTLKISTYGRSINLHSIYRVIYTLGVATDGCRSRPCLACPPLHGASNCRCSQTLALFFSSVSE